MSRMTYEAYLDRVYGCFLGKTVSGTIGAPYEGVKMPMEIPFREEMIHTMLPNDDLDLQVLWLDVAEQKGPAFTSADLLDRFVNYCEYSPGEYAIMRKNFKKGILPPYSGSFCNDFYREGMGCPIRSELWACLAPGDPARAVEFASRDGRLDHAGESVFAEQYFAALEAMAFVEQDVPTLCRNALAFVPEDSKFHRLVENTMSWCAEYGEIRAVLQKILFHYGHPDCTNMFQNMGITLASLLLGDKDIVKTSMMALNCGFDTDCTCASAGAVIGILRGANDLKQGYGIDDVRYVLSVRSNRRSDSVFDLAEDIARLGVAFDASVQNAPAVSYNFEPAQPISVSFEYAGLPACGFGESCRLTARIENRTNRVYRLNLSWTIPTPFVSDSLPNELLLEAGERVDVPICVSVPADARVLMERNPFTLRLSGDVEQTASFGVSGSVAYKVVGPFWRTEPEATTENLLADGHTGYGHILGDSVIQGTATDVTRHFHLNFYPDLEREWLSQANAFRPLGQEDGCCAEVQAISFPEDSFRLDDCFGFQGPCTAYFCRELVSPEDMEVFIQLGHSAPYSLWLNGELISRRDACDTWISENVHVENVRLHAGVNRLLFRVTRVNRDAKMNLIFSYGATCAEHLVCLGSVNPVCFE